MKKIMTVLTVLLSAALLTSCAAPQSAPAAEPEPEPSTDQRAVLEKYQDILEGIYFDYTLPDGQQLDSQMVEDPLSPNQFAIYDVDGDGKDELLIRYINTYVAERFGAVYGYDESTGTLYRQLWEYPVLSFYQNGTVSAGLSHNQGLAGRFWPCFLYRYDPGSDTYVSYAYVDAWDREFFETDWDGNPFPDEIDTGGDGIVYYIYPIGIEAPVDPINQQAFKLWWNEQTGCGESESPADRLIELPYQALNEENIAAITEFLP